MTKKATAEAEVVPATKFHERKLDKALMDAAIERIDEVLETNGASLPLVKKAELLDSFYLRTIPKEDLVECHVCGGHSDGEHMASCPFCGNTEDPPGGDVEVVEAAPVARRSTRPLAVVPRKSTAPPVAARKSEAPLPRKSVAPPAAKAVATTTPASRAFAGKRPAIGAAGAELDEATARIIQLKNDVAKNYWQIGRELAGVHKDELWKQRLDAAGVPIYSSFEKYTRTELNFAGNMAYAMMDVATQYSEKLIAKVGITKLALVLSAPGDVHDELMDEVEKGATRRQLQERVKKERAKKSKAALAAEREARTGRASQPNRAGGRPRKDSRLTVAAVEGKVTLEMYAKPKVKMAPGELPDKRAKRVGDFPFAMEEMSNGVVRYYTVLARASGWKLQIDTLRP